MSDDKLAWIFESSDDEQLAARYDAWAERYDADHDQWEWQGPDHAVERLLAAGRLETVLDAGCGTGRVGRVLRAARWDGELVGIDLSGGMLDRARATDTYDRLVHGSLTDLPLADASVDAYIATGVYTHGHVGPEGFDEALRVTRTGGSIVLTVRAEVWDALQPAAQRLEDDGAWTLVERTDPASFHTGKDDQEDRFQSVVRWRRG